VLYTLTIEIPVIDTMIWIQRREGKKANFYSKIKHWQQSWFDEE